MDDQAREAFLASGITGQAPWGITMAATEPLSDCSDPVNVTAGSLTAITVLRGTVRSREDTDYTTTNALLGLREPETEETAGLARTSVTEDLESYVYSGRPDDLRTIRCAMSSDLFMRRNRLRADVKGVIARRVRDLTNPDDWEEGEPLPDLSSFDQMLQFIEAHPEFRPARIAMTRSGLFEASWRESPDQLVALIFIGDEQIDWMALEPCGTIKRKDDTGAGRCHVASVLEHIAPYGSLEWMKRD